jgi:hypothetical protein
MLRCSINFPARERAADSAERRLHGGTGDQHGARLRTLDVHFLEIPLLLIEPWQEIED